MNAFPPKRIVQEANSRRYGLVAVSAHRRPFSSDVVLGSTVERLLRHSLIPILAVPTGRRIDATTAVAIGA